MVVTIVHSDGERRRLSWSRDSGNEKFVETDDGERRSPWRAYHDNVAVWKDYSDVELPCGSKTVASSAAAVDSGSRA